MRSRDRIAKIDLRRVGYLQPSGPAVNPTDGRRRIKVERAVAGLGVVPHRPAVLTAKLLSTIDFLSKGRLTLGIGVGWCREEFEAIGAAPFDDRGHVTSATDRLRESASGSFSWFGGSKTCRPGSQLPVSTTAQRMIQLSSLNRKSSTLPIVPSVASMAYPWMVEAVHSMFRSPNFPPHLSATMAGRTGS
jgi:hypothetical protein